jgi:hypothetical protein
MSVFAEIAAPHECKEVLNDEPGCVLKLLPIHHGAHDCQKVYFLKLHGGIVATHLGSFYSFLDLRKMFIFSVGLRSFLFQFGDTVTLA